MAATALITLRTTRLVLRPWRDEDGAHYAALNADPVVMEHYPAPFTRAESDAGMARIRAGFGERGWGFWAVEIIGERDFAGILGLSIPHYTTHFTPCVEVGWRLVRSAWGKGYATEGAREALRFGFEELGLEEIVAMTVPRNARSLAVMERLGMRRDRAGDFEHPSVAEGHPLRPHVLYRLGRDAFRRGVT